MKTIKKEMQAMGNKDRLFTGDFIKVILTSMVIGTNSVMLMTTVLLFGMDMGIGDSYSSWLSAAFAIAALLVRPFTGPLVDRFAKRTLTVVGLVVCILSSLSFLVCDSFVLLFLFRILAGAGMAFSSTAAAAIATQLIPKEQITEGIGYFGIGMTLGGAIAPALGISLVNRVGYNGMFLSSAIMQIIAIALIATMRTQPQTTKTAVKADVKCISSILERTAIFASVAMLVVTFTQISVNQYLPFFGELFSITDVSIFFVISSVGVLLPRIFAASIDRAMGVKRMFITGCSLLTTSFLLITFLGHSKPIFLLLAVLYGIGHGLSSMALNSMAVKDTPPERVGAANATYLMASDLGYAISPVLWGIYCSNYGYRSIYLVSAAILIPLLAFSFNKK